MHGYVLLQPTRLAINSNSSWFWDVFGDSRTKIVTLGPIPCHGGTIFGFRTSDVNEAFHRNRKYCFGSLAEVLCQLHVHIFQAETYWGSPAQKGYIILWRTRTSKAKMGTRYDDSLSGQSNANWCLSKSVDPHTSTTFQQMSAPHKLKWTSQRWLGKTWFS